MRTRLDAPLPALRRPPLTIAQARRAIDGGEYRMVTSDVFDTVVWRPVASPHHLFTEMGERLLASGLLRGSIDPQGFALNRIRAENVARKHAYHEFDSPECTLEEIWDALADSCWADGVDPVDGRAAGLATELAVESERLHLHPTSVALLTAARDRGCQVVLVSDSYFSIDQLTRLLTAVGLDMNGIEVETSSAHRRNKWDGLLELAVERRGGADRVLHFGDNPLADVLVADRLGVHVCHVDIFDTDDTVMMAHEPWEVRSHAVGSDGGRSAAIREALIGVEPEIAGSPSYQFGLEVAGPLMAGFAGWVGSTAEQLGAGHIHCLLREGGRIADLIDIVRPDSPPRVLVHASRWAIMRAAVIDGTPRELERALARRASMRADHVAEAFGCDPAAVAEVIGGTTIADNRRADAYDAIAADDALRGEIVAASAALRRNVMSYLDRRLQLDDGPLVLTDIGWGGTIQEGLTAILTEAGFTNDIVGLYALLSPPGEERAGRGALLHSYLPTIGHGGTSIGAARIATRHPEFLERINTPAIGTLLAFTDDGEPVTRPDDHDAISPSLAMAQRGVVDFCRTADRLGLFDADRGTEWFHDETFAAAALDSLVTVVSAPDPRLAAELGTWEHDDVAGTAAEALSNDSFMRWVPYANGVDVGEITMNEVYWVPGVASAAGSALASQIDALAAGAHPDTISPLSPAGMARIALFPPGSPLAHSQLELVPRLGTAGWMLLQHESPVPGVRSIRIDAAATEALVDFGDVRIVLHTASGAERVLVDDVATLRRLGTWVGGRWLGDHTAATSAGGHLLIDLSDDASAEVDHVAVTVGLRVWPTTEGTARALMPRWRTAAHPARLRGLVNRVRSVVIR